MTAIDQAFHREMASQIQRALKEEMRQRPHSTYKDKQTFSKWVNGELRRYGLAVRSAVNELDSKGGEVEVVYPGILKAEPGNHPAEGRFRLVCKNSKGKVIVPISTSSVSTLLDKFSVVADDPDRRRWGKWTAHVQNRDGLSRE